jgi:hypothetical protein
MFKGFLAVALLSSVLAVSGCMGGIPNLGALGSALGGYPGGGGYPAYGGGQAYPSGGGYAQPGYAEPGQPYYQPQVYPGYPGGYAYQPNQAPQATDGSTAAPAGSWIDRRRQHQEARIEQGLASGRLTQDQADRLRARWGISGGTTGQTGTAGTNNNLNTQERGRHHATQPGSTQNTAGQGQNATQPGNTQNPYGQRHNGGQTVAGQTGSAQTGTTAQSQPTVRPMPQMSQAGQPRAMMQPRTTMQPRAMMQPRPTMQSRPATPQRTNSQPRQARML